MSTLLQFTVSNFRSIRDKVSLSMGATSVKDDPAWSVFVTNRHKLLTITAIYGANSSGKSNVILAIRAMRRFVIENVRINDDELFPNYNPFVLDKTSWLEPTHFEIVYITKGLGRVRYGFEHTLETVTGEWLYILPEDTGREEKALFTRKKDEIWLDETLFPEGIDKETNTNDNRLFLSVVAQLGGTVSKRVLAFFQEEFSVISGLHSTDYRMQTRRSFKDHDEISGKAMEFFRHIKLGFEDIEIRERPEMEMTRSGRKVRVPSDYRLQIMTKHVLHNERGEELDTMLMDMNMEESDGTQKIFEMSYAIFRTLAEGNVLVIDELDAKMHPLISQEILKLFAYRETNPLHAQLIFTTHDTNLLSCGLLRRDEIWFTEKMRNEATDLYRLTDLKFGDGTKPRSDANLERNYIRGRYGAIPFITYSDFLTPMTDGKER